MKCPKCDYLSFEPGSRCRNCGYDFSLASTTPAAADVRIDTADETLQSLDLTLARPAAAVEADVALDLDRVIGAPRAVPDLPLFAQDRRVDPVDGDDEAPLITPRPTPRAPLAVRRTAETARMRAMKPRDEPELALEPPTVQARREEPETDQTAATIAWSPFVAAGWGRRLIAALIDFVILGGIDAAVVYFTLQVLGLTTAETFVLPLAPLIAFLVMLDGGYLVAFVAMGGQTIGKMAAGIQVIGDQGHVDFAHAAMRAAGYVVSLAPAGLGVIPAFFGEDRRMLHDRLADTRVVRA